MNGLSGLIRKQAQLMLDKDIYALFNIVMFVLLPYTGWLAGVVFALVTLRKGVKTGGLLFIAAYFTHFFILKRSLPIPEAAIGSLIAYMPCYVASVALYFTNKWRAVAGVLLLQVVLAMCLLHALAPDFILQQFLYMRQVLEQSQLSETLSLLKQLGTGAEQTTFANYFVGVQAAGIVVASVLPLVLARYLQSKLFYPEGFKLEMYALRGTKWDLLLLLLTILAVKQHYLFAINMLPLLVLFFFIMGLSLWFKCASLPGMFIPMLLLSLILGFFPHMMLLVYVMFGSLDTLFNFRSFLQNKVGKAIREVK